MLQTVILRFSLYISFSTTIPMYILNCIKSEDLPMIFFLSISEALIFGSICNSRLSIPMLLSSRYSHCSLVNSSENWRCILLFFLQHRHLNESQLNEFILSAKEEKNWNVCVTWKDQEQRLRFLRTKFAVF